MMPKIAAAKIKRKEYKCAKDKFGFFLIFGGNGFYTYHGGGQLLLRRKSAWWCLTGKGTFKTQPYLPTERYESHWKGYYYLFL